MCAMIRVQNRKEQRQSYLRPQGVVEERKEPKETQNALQTGSQNSQESSGKQLFPRSPISQVEMLLLS